MALTQEKDQLPKAAEDSGLAVNSLAAGGLIGGLLTSSCCLIPLLLASVGVGGTWVSHLTKLAPYQPYLLGLSAAAVGAGLWWSYRKKVVCPAGATCEVAAKRMAARAALWGGAALVVSTFALNSILPYLL